MVYHPSAELTTAIRAVRTSAATCAAVQARLVRADTLQKKDRSPVTVADFASQAIVCAILQRQFPDDAVIGEENADQLRKPAHDAIRGAVIEHVAAGLSDPSVHEKQVLDWIDRGGAQQADLPRFWTVDPIDGTKGFLRGEQYAVALALLEEGEIVLGVLGCPNLHHEHGRGALLAAEKDSGAFLIPWDGTSDKQRSIQVSHITDPGRARFCESVESGHSSHDDAAKIAERLGIGAEPLRMDSQAKYGAVARGEAQIYLRLPTRADYRECIWDHAAGCIVVSEAGGRVTDIHGAPLDFTCGRRLERNQGIVATNGALHTPLLDAIRVTLGLSD
jgi:3'(2'), 5'-bisphosphate nucleotidase